LAAVLFVGCGVDSGVRDANTPSYTGGPGPGLPGGGDNPGSNPGDASAAEQEVFDIVNQEREAAGVNALSWCDGLYELAKAHSNDMCDRGFFSHVNPEGEGPFDRARLGHAGSYTFDPVQCSGENRGGFTHIGVGVCDGCGKHWTQCFR
jgi:uncharacterized protein YkwD